MGHLPRVGGVTGGAKGQQPGDGAPKVLCPEVQLPQHLALARSCLDPVRAGGGIMLPSPLLSGLAPGWIWAKPPFLVPKPLLFLCAPAWGALARVEHI